MKPTAVTIQGFRADGRAKSDDNLMLTRLRERVCGTSRNRHRGRCSGNPGLRDWSATSFAENSRLRDTAQREPRAGATAPCHPLFYRTERRLDVRSECGHGGWIRNIRECRGGGGAWPAASGGGDCAPFGLSYYKFHGRFMDRGFVPDPFCPVRYAEDEAGSRRSAEFPGMACGRPLRFSGGNPRTASGPEDLLVFCDYFHFYSCD